MSEVVERLGLEKVDERGGLVIGRRGHVGVALFNRPEKGNSFNQEMSRTWPSVWEEFDGDDEIRSIVIGSTSSRFFCTGKDVSEVGETGQIGNDLPLRKAFTLTGRNAEIWKPVICAVDGKTVGGGLHFVVDSDIVVAGESATFMDTHVNIGFVGAIENLGLALKAGIGAALYLTLLGRDAFFDARQALQLGLVQEIVETGTAVDRAMQMADIIARSSPSAVSKSLEAVWGLAYYGGYEEALKQGWLLLRRQWDHPDSLEGPKAWAEKREPDWK